MNCNFSLKGKSALVTGSAGYLGRAMSLGLAKAGAKVYLNGRSKESISTLLLKFLDKGYDAVPAVFDITNEQEVKDFFLGLGDNPLDVLLNNAYNGNAGTVETSPSQYYRDSFEISLVATHYLTQAALPLLRKAKKINGDASIINIASMYGMVSPDIRIYDSEEASNPPFYGASKAALIQWTRYAACEFAKEGIRVNSISPGPFPSMEVQENNPILVEKIQNKVPMERLGVPQELIGPVVFLASNCSSYVTGVNLPVDGGWTAW